MSVTGSYTFRPAVRENTPLIIGIAGPTKSGKTYSAHRLAHGLSPSSEIIMLNAEGARGHQYADTFKYTACDLVPPYRYEMYEQALREAAKRKPGAIIIDSISHAHDGPGGFLEHHEEELTRLAGQDAGKRERASYAAWVRPKAAENAFRYALLEMPCAVILCMRAKEKLRIIPGKPPIDLGWQPIVGEPLAFETIFTLMLPPHAKGIPDLDHSEMREPFDAMVEPGQPIDEALGQRLIAWARGKPVVASPDRPQDDRNALLALIGAEKGKLDKQPSIAQWLKIHAAKAGHGELERCDPAALQDFLMWLQRLTGKDAAMLAEAREIVKA